MPTCSDCGQYARRLAANGACACADGYPAPRAQGRALTTSVRGIHAAFAAAYARVQAAAGDPLDLPASAYAAEAAAFNAAILDLERRLAAVLCQARRRGCDPAHVSLSMPDKRRAGRAGV